MGTDSEYNSDSDDETPIANKSAIVISVLNVINILKTFM